MLTGNWCTPRRYLDAAIEVMGAIDLDPTSYSPQVQRYVAAKRYFTSEHEALTSRWTGTGFCKPYQHRLSPFAFRGQADHIACGG